MRKKLAGDWPPSGFLVVLHAGLVAWPVRLCGFGLFSPRAPYGPEKAATEI